MAAPSECTPIGGVSNAQPSAGGVHPGRLALLVAAGVFLVALWGWVLHHSLERASFPVPREAFGWIAATLIVVIPIAIGIQIWTSIPARKGVPVETPDRMYRFLKTTGSLSWAPESRQESLGKLEAGLVCLALDEAVFYYRRRRSSRILSHTLRALAWILGTAGILTPLLSTAISSRGPVSTWGYVLLAASAAMLAANSVFDGTHAHVRATKAQLSIEHLITEFHLTWNMILATNQDFGEQARKEDGVHPGVDAAFAALLAFARAMSGVVNDETGAWATGVVASLEELRASAGPVAANGSVSGTVPTQRSAAGA